MQLLQKENRLLLLQHCRQLFHRVSIICNIACNFVTQKLCTTSHRVSAPYRSLLHTWLPFQIAEASRACLVSYNCVDKYVRLFQHRATLSPLVSDNARPKKIPWWMEAYLEALVRIYPSLYLLELQHFIYLFIYFASPGSYVYIYIYKKKTLMTITKPGRDTTTVRTNYCGPKLIN